MSTPDGNQMLRLVMHGWLCLQRQDSRAEARVLQEQFLQQAKEDLEAFQQNCSAAAAAHHLPSPATLVASSSEDGPAGLRVGEEPLSRHAEGAPAAADAAAHRCAQDTQSHHVFDRMGVFQFCFPETHMHVLLG